MTGKNMIFIGGTGRCGTTITKTLISKHPDVASLPFEYRFMVDPDGLIDFYTSYAETWTPYMASRRIRRLGRLLADLSERNPLKTRYKEWELDKHIPNFKSRSLELICDLEQFCFNGTWVGMHKNESFICYATPKKRSEIIELFREYLNDIIGSIVENQNTKFFVEDNTWNILLARELTELVPESKVIHVIRDPRDVVASMCQQNWCPSDKYQAAIWYKGMMDRWFEIRSEVNEWFQLSLEDLVEDTEHMVRELCDFIGLSYMPSLLDIDLSYSHTGRWKQDFSAKEEKDVNRILKPIIEELGYN